MVRSLHSRFKRKKQKEQKYVVIIVKLVKKVGLFSSVSAFGLAVFMFSSTAFAATAPALGVANTFSILSSTYTNTAPGTTINGDLGYTVPPAVAATVNGTIHVADGTYNQAGIDQGTALVSLNNQPCSFSFTNGPVDLATDTTHGAIGVYTPGVYCITGAATIGTAGITLTGTGNYIFRMDGALTSVANSVVTLAGSASACNVWWTPTAGTTLGANSTFAGTVIDPSGITIGNLTSWNGRALAFGGTVTTSQTTINTIPTCAAASNTSSGNPTNGGSAGAGSSGANKTPSLPNTGNASLARFQDGNKLWWGLLPLAVVSLPALYLVRKKRLNIS